MLKLSEAASLALHTMVYLAALPDQHVSAREIAGDLNVSEAHLSKVLQRLAREGLVDSVRGPKGGFSLSGQQVDVSLLDIYESIEGKMHDRHCFRTTKVCEGKTCIFGDLLGDLSSQVREYLSQTKLPELAGRVGKLQSVGSGNGKNS